MNTSWIRNSILAAGCVIAVAHQGLCQNLLLNGSFETPHLPANTITITNPASWTGSNSMVVNGDYSPGYPLAQDQQQYAHIGHSAHLSQAFTISKAGTYRLSWFDSTEYNGPSLHSPYEVLVKDGASGTVVTTNLDANAIALRQWTPRSLEFPLTGGSYTLHFHGNVGMFGEGSDIDGVSLQRLVDDLEATIHVSAVDICWQGKTNLVYQLQFSSDVSNAVWLNLGPPVPGTGTNCVTDGIRAEKRFYRVVRVE